MLIGSEVLAGIDDDLDCVRSSPSLADRFQDEPGGDGGDPVSVRLHLPRRRRTILDAADLLRPVESCEGVEGILGTRRAGHEKRLALIWLVTILERDRQRPLFVPMLRIDDAVNNVGREEFPGQGWARISGDQLKTCFLASMLNRPRTTSRGANPSS